MDGREESAPAPVLPPGGRGGDSAAGERSGSSYLQPKPVVTSMEEQPEVSHEEPEEVKTEKSSEDNRWHSQSYTLGAISSFLSTFVTFPIYKLVFRQQIHAVSVPQAVNQLHQEGPCRFYRGIYPPLLAKTLQGTLLFGTHNNVLQYLSPTGHSRLWQRWVAGSLSGVVEAVVLTPFERVQNVLQDGRKDARFPSTSSILQEFNSYSFWERLAMGYYRGFFPVLLRNSLGSALYFSFKDPIRDSLMEQDLPSWVPALVSGSVNGTLTCLLLYPLSVLVANMQSQVGWQEAPGLRASAQAVWEDRGRKLSLLYRGGSLVILRSCVTWGLTTAIHDFLQESNRPKVEESD
ncbi:solute carrier family 25 member 53 [Sarcophilus harrisii]|uniref:Solute carrier family 25 member 53 n=2 Tax=Sarcophilus harrisii TaxID=9305 RepID=A0A7N4PLL3_SARHA|nr:solute carrier family 25 member 53 [Sarcophilus harrisii]